MTVILSSAGVSPRPEVGAHHHRPFVTLRAGLAGSERIQTAHIAETIPLQPAETAEMIPFGYKWIVTNASRRSERRTLSPACRLKGT
jgi:hypothetical protein